MQTYKLEYKLFEKLSSDYRETQPLMNGKIPCPLCLNIFSREDIENKCLSLEHIIPRKLGGSVYTLSCKSCNNRHGTELDNHLIKMLKFGEAMAGNGSLDCNLIVGKHSTQSTFRLDPGDVDTINMTILEKTNNPQNVARVRDAFESNLEEFQVTIKPGYKSDRAPLAIVKCAYLAAFRQIGYRYILDPAFAAFQEHLKETTSGLRIYNPLVVSVSKFSFARQKQIQFIDMSRSMLPKCFLVLMKFSKVKTKCWGAYLPYPGTSFQQLAIEMADHISRNGKSNTVTISNIDVC